MRAEKRRSTEAVTNGHKLLLAIGSLIDGYTEHDMTQALITASNVNKDIRQRGVTPIWSAHLLTVLQTILKMKRLE